MARGLVTRNDLELVKHSGSLWSAQHNHNALCCVFMWFQTRSSDRNHTVRLKKTMYHFFLAQAIYDVYTLFPNKQFRVLHQASEIILSMFR